MKHVIVFACASIACTSVLKVDGTYVSVAESACSNAQSICAKQNITLTGFDETTCEASFRDDVDSTAYAGCYNSDTTCAAFIACVEVDVLDDDCATGQPAKGRPCTSSASCCGETCNGSPGTCQ